MVKKIDEHIMKAFTDLGFSKDEVREGCWCLERGGKKIAWIALHKFLERVALKANIEFSKPEVLCSEKDYYDSTKWVDGKKTSCEKETRNIALYVRGSVGSFNQNTGEYIETMSAWAIGEVSGRNCLNDYPWAMAEKRAKDRVILKLLGVAGDMYSEEEADDFKKQPKEEPKAEPMNITPHTPEAIADTFLIVERDLNNCHTMEQLEEVKVGLRLIADRFQKRKDEDSLQALKELVADKEEQLKGE